MHHGLGDHHFAGFGVTGLGFLLKRVAVFRFDQFGGFRA